MLQGRIASVSELSLTANQPLSSIHRLQWKSADGADMAKAVPPPPVGPAYNVTLTPMQFRTFEVKLSSAPAL